MPTDEEENPDLTQVSVERLQALTFDAIVARDSAGLDLLEAEWFRRAEHSRKLGELARDHRRKYARHD